MNQKLKLAFLLVPSLMAAPALADRPASPAPEADRAAATTAAPPRVHYEFDDDEVTGELYRPDEVVVGVSHHPKHPSLIKIREHFVAEMVKSSDDL